MKKMMQKGFTLIELLVVVAILGVMAALIVPNLAKFIGSGTIEAANTEVHNVQTAVIAYMADNNEISVPANSQVGPNVDIGPGSNGTRVSDFITDSLGLQATYNIDADGAITGATALADGKWQGLVFTVGTGWGEPAAP